MLAPYHCSSNSDPLGHLKNFVSVVIEFENGAGASITLKECDSLAHETLKQRMEEMCYQRRFQDMEREKCRELFDTQDTLTVKVVCKMIIIYASKREDMGGGMGQLGGGGGLKDRMATTG